MPKIYMWFLDKYNSYTLINGVVTGHNRIMDGIFIHTSPIEAIRVDGTDIILQTANSMYIATLDEVNLSKARHYFLNPDLNIQGMRELMDLVKSYNPSRDIEIPDIEENSVLIRFGNNREYYLDSLWVNHDGEVVRLTDIYPHIGMFQDSILCMMDEYRIDIRYFPYQFGNIEFYSFETDGKPVYIENFGDSEFKAEVYGKVYVLKPGERKLVSIENASNSKLDNYSDMYPAVEIKEVKDNENT